MIRWKRQVARVLIAGAAFATVEPVSECCAQSRNATEFADSEGAALQKKVIAQIDENYRRLPVVHCRMVMTIQNPKIKQREVIRGKTDDGALVEARVAPQTISELELILSPSSFRADCVDRETGERSSRAMHRGIWTDYSPAHNWASRCYRRDMAGIVNCDPRNFGASGQKEVFLEEFAGDRVVKQELEKTRNGERLVLHMERLVPAAGVSLSYRYEFDPRRNHLPCRIVYFTPKDGKIISVLDIEYDEVARAFAWFPKKLTQRFFADAHTETSEQSGWTQQVSFELSHVRTDETFADTAFDIDIAPGTTLQDNTLGRDPPSTD